MTREEAKELLPIMQAFVEGKQIQDKIEGLTDWCDTDEIYLQYEGKKLKHRIKPEPKYRPFKNKEECWQEMQNHQPFGWIKRNGVYVNITLVSDSSDYDGYFKTANFVDGTPFGIKED